MLKMEEIFNRVKDVLSNKYDGTVLDKNVAYELGITPTALATQKNRNLLPFMALTEFCLRYKVNINWLFYNIGTKELDYAKENM